MLFLSFLVVPALFATAAEIDVSEDFTRYVNAFIGTQGTAPGTSYNGGNVFPGAAVPFGVVKCGIEFNTSVDANGGYTPDGNVTAISLLHESGTGGAVKYGVVPQMPLTSLDSVNVLDNATYMQPRIGNDTMSVGYYKTMLGNGVIAELSATRHVGVMKYTYPAFGSRYVLVDISHYLPTNDETQHAQFYSNGHLETSQDGQMYTGYGIWRGGWNAGPDYQVYYCGRFSETPISAKLFTGAYTDPYWPNSTNSRPLWLNSSASVAGGAAGYNYAERIGSLFEFASNTTTVMSKVGVSWLSADKACQFVNDEVPSWDMNETVQAAKSEWSSDILSRISTTDLSNSTRLEMFYSALYKMHLIPSDRSGENPYWTSSEPYYDDYYTLWDTFRCTNSLWLLIEPDRASGMIRSLIDIWRHERFMPDGRSSNYNGRVQGGSNADNVLADAYVKGLQYGINWRDAYAAMKTDAEVVPYNTFDVEDPTQSTKEGRGAQPDWFDHGYVTPKYGRSISKTVEYSLNDFSLSQLAKDIAPDDYQKYLRRSANWQNLWSHNLTSLNFTGFLAPRYANGSTDPSFDPTSCGSCEWDAYTYEATVWEYSWTVPFDMATLISFMGGPNTTEARLDAMFVPGLRTTAVGSGGTNGIGDTLFNPGNEPSFSTPFLYNYLGRRQYKSVLRSRQTVNQYYNAGPSGLPGNSDGGSLDSWLVWNMLGMYPVVTQPVYLLLSPWFSDITITIPADSNGTASAKTLRITAEGLSDESYFVQSVTVNGVPWNKSWVSHDEISGGGSIEFVLGPEMVEWDVGEQPPSPGHVQH
ncbi:glycoside hydrolase family 92 protein [Saccharata proteae CBS 121410]|uniref:Glycoside hydrolase family 92 protein n=1 Tax=Saccharata proteae CBS 121410 TaxID=1314787 RepID=A0A9P4HV33_9PEZI|nr:glycoside hydrolase family 92 protein [Saccharata proteae CBS 121410]